MVMKGTIGGSSMEFALLAGDVTVAVSFCALWDQKDSY